MRSVSRATFSVTPSREQRLLLKRRLAETEIANVSAAAYSPEWRSLSNCLFAETEFDSAVHEYRSLSKRIFVKSKLDNVSAVAHSREYCSLSKRVSEETKLYNSKDEKTQVRIFAEMGEKL